MGWPRETDIAPPWVVDEPSGVNSKHTGWRLERINWHSRGLCWRWSSIKKFVYYSGNQVQFVWGRVAFVFERKVWMS
jgi:hypothetical protein